MDRQHLYNIPYLVFRIVCEIIFFCNHMLTLLGQAYQNQNVISDTVFETSITDMPSEVIEVIGQWLPLESINNLMSVSTYLHDVFNHSTIWKRYLYYPERYYESDIHSRSSTPLVAEVVDKILAGRLSKWRGYFMLQQVRINSLQTKESYEPFSNISLSNRYSLSHMYDMVDDHDEHWLFIQADNNLHIWNVTAIPRASSSLSLSRQGNGQCEVLELLPQGKLLLKETDGPRCIIHVYQFESPNYNMNLQFKFVYNMDAILSPTLRIPENEVEIEGSGKIHSFTHATLGTTFISCKSLGSLPELKLLTLHVWNLNSGVKTDKIPLGQSMAVIKFLKRVNKPDSLSSQCQNSKYLVMLHPGSTSNIVVIVFIFAHSKQVNVFDLKTKLFTFMEYSEFEKKYYYPDVVRCHVFGDKLCVAVNTSISDQPWVTVMSFLTVYSTTVPKDVSQTPAPHPLATLSCAKGEYSSIKYGDFRVMDNIISFKQSKVLVQDGNTVTIVNLNTMQETQVTIYPSLPEDPREQINIGCVVLAFIEPRYLLVYNASWNQVMTGGRRNDVWDGNVKMIDVVRNLELYTWENISLSEQAISYYYKLQYPSRIAFQYHNNLQLFVN